ncbi:MIP/aquaporin family protein [Hymenobacter glacialis]|uniref:Aquaporin n=1 Tax=Hymenobacter glacialis TaxID=1908236 RepID=A0A1G1TAV2_9BACT|nr:aquaporin [Hymenobacter glacialis]OGX88008.1 hypothetical protein BEN48_10615 [Hymenobacter glacialis]
MQIAKEAIAALRSHWKFYLAEAAGLAFFITCASLLTTALEHPAFWLHQALAGQELLRRGILGTGMALVIAAIVYSPWGKQSGAHINPAVTLVFWQLNKLRAVDAYWYIAAQVGGGVAAALFCTLVLGHYYAHPSVHHVTTQPGPAGVGVAFAAEFLISFVMVAVLLVALHRSRLKNAAGWLLGGLIFLYILLETPYSGMSLNPARSLASAVAAQDYRSLWVYLLAPPIATWLATVLFLRFHHGQPLECAIVAGCAPTPGSPHLREEPPHYPAAQVE